MKAWTTLFPLYRKSGSEGGERNTEKPEEDEDEGDMCDLAAHIQSTQKWFPRLRNRCQCKTLLGRLGVSSI